MANVPQRVLDIAREMHLDGEDRERFFRLIPLHDPLDRASEDYLKTLACDVVLQRRADPKAVGMRGPAPTWAEIAKQAQEIVEEHPQLGRANPPNLWASPRKGEPYRRLTESEIADGWGYVHQDKTDPLRATGVEKPAWTEKTSRYPWLQESVARAAALWPSCPDNADSNPRDAYWLARTIQENVGVSLPVWKIGQMEAVAVCEAVDRWYIAIVEKDAVVREIEPEGVYQRCERLLDKLKEHGLVELPLLGPDEPQSVCPDAQRLCIALSVWYGCMMMGKILRQTARSPEDVAGVDSGGSRPESMGKPTFVPIHVDERWRGYDVLARIANDEDAHGNPWVTVGIGTTRAFELHRHNLSVDYFVPRDSPYWS